MARRGECGPHTFPSRWARERRRSPEIAAVKVGETVSREFHGVTYEALCCEGHWLFQGKQYPTLYTVVLAITGPREYPRSDGAQERRSMSNWSAARFFRLKERGKEE